jgi:hypothetical protein
LPRHARLGLRQHFGRGIDAGDAACRRRLGGERDSDAGPEPHFEHRILGFDHKPIDDPGGAVAIAARHERAADASEQPFRPAERAHEKAAQQTHPWVKFRESWSAQAAKNPPRPAATTIGSREGSGGPGLRGTLSRPGAPPRSN